MCSSQSTVRRMFSRECHVALDQPDVSSVSALSTKLPGIWSGQRNEPISVIWRSRRDSIELTRAT